MIPIPWPYIWWYTWFAALTLPIELIFPGKFSEFPYDNALPKDRGHAMDVQLRRMRLPFEGENP